MSSRCPAFYAIHGEVCVCIQYYVQCLRTYVRTVNLVVCARGELKNRIAIASLSISLYNCLFIVYRTVCDACCHFVPECARGTACTFHLSVARGMWAVETFHQERSKTKGATKWISFSFAHNNIYACECAFSAYPFSPYRPRPSNLFTVWMCATANAFSFFAASAYLDSVICFYFSSFPILYSSFCILRLRQVENIGWKERKQSWPAADGWRMKWIEGNEFGRDTV